MLDRLTERAQRMMGFGKQESQRLKHDHLGTEHVLLGMVKEGTGVGAGVLLELGINLDDLREEIERRSHGPNTANPPEDPRYTARLLRTFEYAEEEAASTGHSLIDTEHVLLGILREPDGTAARALIKLGASAEAIRSSIRGKVSESPIAENDLRARALADLQANGVSLAEHSLRQVAAAIVKAGWRPRP